MEMAEPGLCRLLVDCLKRGGPAVEAARLSGLTQEDRQAFLALAAAQRVRPLLWHRLTQKGLCDAVPAEAAEALRNASLRNTMSNLRLYGELRRLLFALKREGIPLILLKGIYLADALYGDIGLREMHDIDVLARPADLTRVADILMNMGYIPEQPIDADITINADHHLPTLVKKGCGSFEVHWNLTRSGDSYNIDPVGLWERSMPVHIAGCDAMALSPEDLLLHLCMHVSYQHRFAFGLRPLCDIAETIARFGPTLDWQVIIERAGLWGWQRGVYLALQLARELAGADVPAGIMEKLRPADMTEDVLEIACAQVFTDKNLVYSIPTPFAELLQSRGLWDKNRIFWERVFLPKAIIAAQYSVPADSARIYGCYLRRFVDVLRRHGHTMTQYRRDEQVKAVVERTSRIACWLSGQAISRK
ncbi:MAG: hypothetical protein A4E64_01704 [Syntrophorhabdus sp. PtaU1.Bin058]|nr:MAG: hypothetical protein A4E64_01704 [Syntrophorhabdus sp. PtaU1.Bin058]